MSRLTRLVEALDQGALRLALLALLITAGLAYPARQLPPSEVASTRPDSALFQAQEALRREMSGPVHVLTFVVEDPGGDLWRPEPLRALERMSAGLREGPLQDRLWRYDSFLYKRSFLGLLSPSDLIQQASEGRAVSALTDEQLIALSAPVATQVNQSPSQLIIPSGMSERRDGRWRSPALILNVLADLKKIGGELGSLSLNRADPPEERYGREVLASLRAHSGHLKVRGVALDVNLSTEEQGARSGAFIGLALLVTMLLLAVSLRSYWAVTLMGLALATLMIWLKGMSNLIGLKSDPILSLIVPIAMISFGVDAGVHSVARYQEERGDGHGPERSLRLALIGTLGALSLAAFTDLSAFLVNLLSELESVRQFGVASAIALTCSFLLLGVLCPLLLARIERATQPGSAHPALRWLGLALTSLMATAVVMSVVFIDLELGLGLYVIYGLLGLGLPLWLRARRAEPPRSREGGPTRAYSSKETSGLLSAVSALVYRRPQLVVLCGAALLGASLPLAQRVRVEFDIRQLLDPSSELVQGLDTLDQHLTGRGGEPSSIYISGPLTHPDALEALQASASELRAIQSPLLARTAQGETRVDGGLIDLWSATLNAHPLTAKRLTRATLERWLSEGAGDVALVGEKPNGAPSSAIRWAPDEVATMLWLSPGRGASPERVSTRFELQLAQTQSSVGIKEAVALLTPHLTSLEAKLKALDPSARVTLTGGAVSRQAELDAISQSMLTALPVALALCLLIVGLALRSVYQSLCCVLTLAVVVALLFAGMSVFGYALNFMSATLGALSIGVGVDYATHITVRITEERDEAHLSERALQRAIAGTGLALLVSAGSSVLGFCVLGMAPMPLFAAYGRFTALMITLALVSSITLLPALLLLPDRLRKRHHHHA